MTKYTLDAHNEQGDQIYLYGNTIKSVIAQFDSLYYKSGWRIHIEDEYGRLIKTIRDTFKKSKGHGLHYGYKTTNIL